MLCLYLHLCFRGIFNFETPAHHCVPAAAAAVGKRADGPLADRRVAGAPDIAPYKTHSVVRAQATRGVSYGFVQHERLQSAPAITRRAAC